MQQPARVRRLQNLVVVLVVVGVGVGALLGGLWPARAQESAMAAYFTDNVANTIITETVTPLEQALIDRLDAATTSIDVAIYDFSRISIRNALLRAHNERGVTVRVVGDNEARGALGSRENFDALEAAGIPVVVDGVVPTGTATLDLLADLQVAGAQQDAPNAILQSLIMHNKYFIVDGRWVWTGSVNMSDSDITLNHNNALDIESPALAALYQGDFEQMFAGVFGTDKSVVPTHTVEISGATASVYFAPQDNPIEQVIAAVKGAQRSIDFAIFTFTDDALADALIAAQARGVRVRGLWDNLAAGNPYADDERMCEAGLAIKFEKTRGLMHNKLLVIDADAAQPRVLTGSLNWTAGGNNGNNENTLLIASAPLAQQYGAAYEALWSEIGVEPCNIERPLSWSVNVPIVFNNGEPATPTPLPLELTPTETPTPEASVTPGSTPEPTPGSTPTGTVESSVRLSRIVYNPPGDDVASELVEISNDGAISVTLTAWTLSDAANTPNVFVFPVFTLAPGGAVKVWVTEGMDDAGNLYWGRGGAVWNNDGDEATLRDEVGNLVDACAYVPDTGEALCP
jgi:phosphatidylserine/phosphatidylglycerophosphate/cardiolipin synthase-like enzyme